PFGDRSRLHLQLGHHLHVRLARVEFAREWLSSRMSWWRSDGCCIQQPVPDRRGQMATLATSAFPSPFEIETPPGCEGWEEMYPYYALFDERRRESDENRFWFWNS